MIQHNEKEAVSYGRGSLGGRIEWTPLAVGAVKLNFVRCSMVEWARLGWGYV